MSILHSRPDFSRRSLLRVISIGIAGVLTTCSIGQESLKVDGASFNGVLHDNVANRQRQGSGFSPLTCKAYPNQSLFRDDAVGLNFEHIFNGARAQREISMFTPREDPCRVQRVGTHQFEIRWPSQGSQWGLEAHTTYDVSHEGRVDIAYECSPKLALYPKKYVAMMWASYMNRALDRRIHFWGQDGERTGWIEFGTGKGHDIEVGTVGHVSAPSLPFEEGAQTLNVVEHPTKKFVIPFYYGVLDGDHDLTTTDDRLLFLVLFDQAEPIRFAMWNFFKDARGLPDTHSPAWDWQYVVRDPVISKTYGYRARVVVRPYEGREQVWNEYRRWRDETGRELPERPAASR